MLHALDHELGDLVAAGYLDRRVRVGVQKNDGDLASVVTVDEAGRVDHGEPFAQGAPAPRKDESGISFRNRNGDACSYQGAVTGSDCGAVGGVQIESGVTVVGVSRKRQFTVKPYHGNGKRW